MTMKAGFSRSDYAQMMLLDAEGYDAVHISKVIKVQVPLIERSLALRKSDDKPLTPTEKGRATKARNKARTNASFV